MLDWLGPDYITREQFLLRGYPVIPLMATSYLVEDSDDFTSTFDKLVIGQKTLLLKSLVQPLKLVLHFFRELFSAKKKNVILERFVKSLR
jgi:hypothetical protein